MQSSENNDGEKRLLFLDIESNGTNENPNHDPKFWELTWQLYSENGSLLVSKGYDNYDFFTHTYSFKQLGAHSSRHNNQTNNVNIKDILKSFISDAEKCDIIVAHNIDYEIRIITRVFWWTLGFKHDLNDKVKFCTMKDPRIIEYCEKFEKYGTNKWPSLSELHNLLFDEDLKGAHAATNDTVACAKCFFELKRRKIITI